MRRYLSHFRSVHRGAYFAQLRTTAVRKLLPESWGFMCPVHTPDGSPCAFLHIHIKNIVTCLHHYFTKYGNQLSSRVQKFVLFCSREANSWLA